MRSGQTSWPGAMLASIHRPARVNFQRRPPAATQEGGNIVIDFLDFSADGKKMFLACRNGVDRHVVVQTRAVDCGNVLAEYREEDALGRREPK